MCHIGFVEWIVVAHLQSPFASIKDRARQVNTLSAHLIRYYGWYSNKARGTRRKAAEAAEQAAATSPLPPGEVRVRRGPLQPDLGDAHQAGVRDRPAACPQCGGADEGDRVY